VSPLKRNRKEAQPAHEQGDRFKIRSGADWDIVVGRDGQQEAPRQPVESTPPSTAPIGQKAPGSTRAPDRNEGWLANPATAPAAEAILASLNSRVQKLETAVRRLEERLSEITPTTG
jgi:hypothetical protein